MVSPWIAVFWKAFTFMLTNMRMSELGNNNSKGTSVIMENHKVYNYPVVIVRKCVIYSFVSFYLPDRLRIFD